MTKWQRETKLTAERLRELLNYDRATGLFAWRVIRKWHFSPKSVVGSINRWGYRKIRLDGQVYHAHRLAWLYVHGEWPAGQIDHKDAVRDHNWIDNLRLATNSQNQANSQLSIKRNSSGFKGVHFHQPNKKWRARIGVRGAIIHLGLFTTPEAAHKAYMDAARKYFGEFARAA